MNRRPGRALSILVLALTLALNACGFASSDVAPSITAVAVFTAAYQTFSAQQATRLALAPPTETPSPSLVPTLPPPSPIATSASSGQSLGTGSQAACDNNAWLADVTIPDGAAIDAGAKFTKTWLLMNTGNCPWTTSYSLIFQSGDPMGGSDSFISAPVPAGAQAEISTTLVAPASSGTYTGWWRMKNAQQQPFGKVITVEIQVGSSAACRHPSRGNITISGHAGPENVTIDYGDGAVVTDAHGDYSFTVPAGWSGTVTPWKAKVHPWTFDPEHRTYTNVSCDLNRENYHATAPPGV
jgi:hypothetical protein